MAEKKTEKDRIPREIRESAHKIWLAGLGALNTAEEEGSKLFKNLVERGKRYEAKGRETVDEVKDDLEGAVDKARGRAESAWDRFEERSDEWMAKTLERFGVPTREEIATLTRRVEELTTVVEKLNAAAAGGSSSAKAPARKTAAKKPAAKKPAADTSESASGAAN